MAIVYRDYGDFPLNAPPARRKTAAALESLKNIAAPPDRFECIHGHFLPVKYRWVRLRRAVQFITWMRDPVERLASHYHFWKRSYDPRSSRPLHRRVVEDDWPFDRFYRSPELRNVYAQFLWGFPLTNFDFVGITEHYDEDFRFFVEAFLGASLPAHRVETNTARESLLYVTDPRVRAEIEQLHRKDMALYRRALELRRQQRAQRPPAVPREPPRFGRETKSTQA